MQLKLTSKEITFAAILALGPGEQDSMAMQFIGSKKSIRNDQEAQKENAKVIGKLACALEIRLENGKKVNAFPANKTLTDFFKDITGEKPQTHVLSLKNAFGAFVKTDMMAEEHYDNNSNNCLELAARIVDAVKGDLTHPVIPKVITLLKERTPKEASGLRDVLESVKPTAKLTPEEALEMFQKIADDGQLNVVLAEMPDIVLKMSEGDQRSSYLTFVNALERFDKAVGAKIDQWQAEHTKATAPIQLITAGTPANPPATETPATKPQGSKKNTAPKAPVPTETAAAS